MEVFAVRESLFRSQGSLSANTSFKTALLSSNLPETNKLQGFVRDSNAIRQICLNAPFGLPKLAGFHAKWLFVGRYHWSLPSYALVSVGLVRLKIERIGVSSFLVDKAGC